MKNFTAFQDFNYSNLSDHSCFFPFKDEKKTILFLSNLYPIPSYFYSISSILTFTNVVGVDEEILPAIIPENTVESSVSEYKPPLNESTNFTNFPIFDSGHSITIPRKVEYALRRHTPKNFLYEIDKDFNTAVELCLLMVSKFSNTYYVYREDDDVDSSAGETEEIGQGWKALNSRKLKSDFKWDGSAYRRILDALMYPLLGGSILECNGSYEPGVVSYKYRLSDGYRCKGTTPYFLKQEKPKKILEAQIERIQEEGKYNAIVQMQTEALRRSTFPKLEQSVEKGRLLVKSKHITKKGKILKSLNKKKRTHYDLTETALLEDHLERYQSLLHSTKLRVPRATHERNGGRVVDLITLMPSWICEEVLLDGERTVECDFRCLHPNIAMMLYGGSSKYLTHAMIAEDLGIDLIKVKKAHLTFFNMKERDMWHSKIYPFYKKNESETLCKILSEKKQTEREHKITSQRLFTVETQLMTAITEKLLSLGIVVFYKYDALRCKVSDRDEVVRIMNETALEMGIYTTASCDYDKILFTL